MLSDLNRKNTVIFASLVSLETQTRTTGAEITVPWRALTHVNTC